MKAFLIRLALVSVLGAVTAVVSIGRVAALQQPNADTERNTDTSVAAEEGMRPSHQGVDVGFCIKCHQMSEEQRNNPGYEKATREFIKYDEIRTWNRRDLHRNAFTNIKASATAGPNGGPNLAWKMEQILRQSPSRQKKADGKEYQVAQATECLACHAVDTSWKPKEGSSDPIAAGQIDNQEDPRFDMRYGVSCEGCHGIVSQNWGLGHADPQHRKKLPADKLNEGQIDLRDPRVRAERCASCHIGSAGEHKFVTHEMYAAGHPPLPSFELSAYGKLQPAHYIPSRDNVYFKKELQNEKDGKQKKNVPSVEARFHYREGENAEVRALVYGAVVRLRATCQMLEKDSAEGTMVDFAHFDCAACHHDLKSPSERQFRKDGISGRPVMKLQTQLLDIVLADACRPRDDDSEALRASRTKLQALRADYLQKMKELTDAFVARPFGDTKQIKAISAELVAISDGILKGLEQVKYDEPRARELLKALLHKLEERSKAGSTIDHDSAQEIAWAALVLHEALASEGKEPPLENDPNWKTVNETVEVILRRPSDKEPLQSVEKRLGERLRKQYLFESDKFYKALETLRPDKP